MRGVACIEAVSWLLAYLPPLPPLALPSLPALQRSFLAFLLKRAVGHLVKGGQVHLEQVDAQLGDGRFEIGRVELDERAINELLKGLQLELEEGSLGRVQARVPWSNFWADPLFLSVDTLTLTFRPAPHVPSPSDAAHNFPADLAQSISSAASTFFHTEQEALGEAAAIPGSFSPSSAAAAAAPVQQAESASLLASVLDRILARFEFAARETVVRLRHAGAEVELRVEEVRYGDEEGEGCTLRIAGVGAWMTVPGGEGGTGAEEDDDGASSYASEQESEEEENGEASMMLMSQAIADLRASHISTTTTTPGASTTLFHSAISDAPSRRSPSPLPPSPPSPPPGKAAPAPTRILALTPSLIRLSPSDSPSMTISIPTITVLLRPPQTRALLSILHALPPSAPSAPPAAAPPAPASPAPKPLRNFTLTLKSLHFFLLLDHPPSPVPEALFARPSSTPIPSAHFRLRVETVSASLSSLSVADLALTSHHPASPFPSEPILIFDPYLARAPVTLLETDDWLHPLARQPIYDDRTWRVRPVSAQPRISARAAAPEAVVRVTMREGESARVDLAPVHLFVDLQTVQRLEKFAGTLPSAPPSSFLSPPPSPSPWSCKPTPTLAIPHLRISLRAPAPRSFRPRGASPLRSGILTLGLSGLSVGLGGAGSVRAGWESVGGWWTPAEETRASPFLSLSTPTSFSTTTGRPQNRLTLETSPRMCVRAHIPHAKIDLHQRTVEGLQLLADDVGQWAEGRAAPGGERDGQRDRMIGTRYFGRSGGRAVFGAAGEEEEEGAEGRKSRVEVDVGVGEVAGNTVEVVLHVPRSDGDGTGERVLNAGVQGLEVGLKMLEGGKDETVITVTAQRAALSSEEGKRQILQMTTSALAAPFLNLRMFSWVDPDVGLKDSKISLTLAGFTLALRPHEDMEWIADVVRFAKTPEGAFESAIPTELVRLSLTLSNASLHLTPSTLPAARAVLVLGSATVRTDLAPDAVRSKVDLDAGGLGLWLVDVEARAVKREGGAEEGGEAGEYWKRQGFAQLVDVVALKGCVSSSTSVGPPEVEVDVSKLDVRLALCPDSLVTLGAFAGDLAPPSEPVTPPPSATAPRDSPRSEKRRMDLLASLDEHAFRGVPGLGPQLDMVDDDVPRNLDYLDEALPLPSSRKATTAPTPHDDDFSAWAGGGAGSLRSPSTASSPDSPEFGFTGIGNQTEVVRIIDPGGIQIIENYFAKIEAPEEDMLGSKLPSSSFRLRLRNCDISVNLHDGYDWYSTRKAIEDEVKRVRRRLVKIRQLLAEGQTPDETIDDADEEDASAFLFNSVYVGLPGDARDMDHDALMAALDEELRDDTDDPAAPGSPESDSWQSLPRRGLASAPAPAGEAAATAARRDEPAARVKGKKLTRSRAPQVEFSLRGVEADVDRLSSPKTDGGGTHEGLVSRLIVAVRDFEILDHIKTSTWRTFLTELRTTSRGGVRETGSSMVRLDLRTVQPALNAQEETRVQAKILPLKLNVDQDALDFLKKFFAFHDPSAPAVPEVSSSSGPYLQSVIVHPIEIKLDYKPKRVDYRALREGRTIELMNFFHFDGAEMTLRKVTLSGIIGWPRLFNLLNDIWTPDVKANQLADVLSGISPVRSLVNVGSGVADLVLLPLEQYRRDRRLVRGLQKGTSAFARSAGLEALRFGARLATGTQVVLERAEGVLGGRFGEQVIGEVGAGAGGRIASGGGTPRRDGGTGSEDEAEGLREVLSKYADQPKDVREGLESAYRSLGKNLSSAAQTILAVPMEVFEKSGSEGPGRAVVRAVPIAVLKPLIGASEAAGKIGLGLLNTLDPAARRENDEKYKRRSGSGSGSGG